MPLPDASMSIAINPETIKAIVEAKITAATAEALGDGRLLFGELAERILSQKVDDRGETSNSSWAKPRIRQIVEQAITNATREGVAKIIAENDTAFRASIMAYLNKKSNRDKLVESFFDTILKAAKSQYYMKIDFKVGDE